MTLDDVLDAMESGRIGAAVCARDLPMHPVPAAALLRRGWNEGALHRLLPGVYCGLTESALLGRDVPAASHQQAAAAYGRLHGRMILPAPAAAANMVGLSEQVPSALLLTWPGPARRFRDGMHMDLTPMPDWAAARTGDPAIPFLLALSAWNASWDSRELDALARRLGADHSRTIASSRRRGLPRTLSLCLDRFRRATIRIHGPASPPADPRAVVHAVAGEKAPTKPFDRCRATSARIVSTLAARGIASRILRCAGWRGGDTPREDPRWGDMPPEHRVHYVVHVPALDMVVDATWRQFDASADPVRIGTLSSTSSEWNAVEGIDR